MLARSVGSLSESSLPSVSDEPDARSYGGKVSRLQAVLSGTLTLRRPLPALVARKLRQRLCFPAQEYQRKRADGLSLRNVRRLVPGWERRGDAWRVPRGLEREVRAWCVEEGVELDLIDARVNHPGECLLSRVEVPEGYRETLARLVEQPSAVLRTPDEIARTVLALAVCAHRGQPALLLTTRRTRVLFWRQQAILAGISEDDIGSLEDETRNRLLVLGTCSEALDHPVPIGLLFGTLVLDECSRVPLAAFLDAARSVPAQFVLGLHDATPRVDGLDDLCALNIGPVVSLRADHPENLVDVVIRSTRFTCQTSEQPQIVELSDGSENEQPEGELFDMPRPHRNVSQPQASPSERSREWHALLDALSQDTVRNRLIVDDVVAQARLGVRCVVLTARREHATGLSARIGEYVPVATATGGSPLPKRCEALADVREGRSSVLVATDGLVGPGFDPGPVSCLFLALPIKEEGHLHVLLNWLTRAGNAQGQVRVYDYADERVPRLARMLGARRRYYRRTATTLNPDEMQPYLPFSDF